MLELDRIALFDQISTTSIGQMSLQVLELCHARLGFLDSDKVYMTVVGGRAASKVNAFFYFKLSYFVKPFFFLRPSADFSAVTPESTPAGCSFRAHIDPHKILTLSVFSNMQKSARTHHFAGSH
jgi:hypothetical protein